jgi:lambda family phage minor tail protein L
MVPLLTIHPDPEGHPAEILRLALCSSDVLYKGQTYIAFNFDLEPIFDRNTGELQQLKLSVSNVNGMLQGYAEEYGGLVGAKIEFQVVTTTDLDGDPLEFYEFEVIAAQANAQTVDLTLGAPSPLRKKFPKHVYRKDHCMWRYESVQCGYAGALADCDHTLSGENGCIVHANALRFGAFPSIDSSGIFTASPV